MYARQAGVNGGMPQVSGDSASRARFRGDAAGRVNGRMIVSGAIQQQVRSL
jgi:hypothetical protein